MLDIIGIGDTNIDLIIKVDHIPGYDEKVKGELLGRFPGGVVGNFCCAAAKFGAFTGIVAKIGNDEYGKLCKEDFICRGVDIRGLIKKDNVETYFCVIHLDHTGEKALTVVETSGFLPKKDEIDLDYVRNARYVHMTTLDVELADYVFNLLEGSRCFLSLDIEATASKAGSSTWENILSKLDIAFPNAAGLAALTNTQDIDEGAQFLLDRGVKMVVVTRGAQGVNIFKQGFYFEHPVYQVDVKDTTGAGDCFNAVFITCLSKNWSVEISAKYASAAAAISIQTIGARGGLPSCDEVTEFLKKRGEI